MGLVRCVVFVSLPTIHQYEAMGHKVGQSRSSLMRFALESGLADVERFVRRFRSTGEPQVAAVPSDPDAPLQRRRGRPSGADRVRQLATLENLVQRTLHEASHLDVDAVRRLVMLNAEAFLGAPPNADLLEQALARIFSQRSEDAPEPVGGNRPPE